MSYTNKLTNQNSICHDNGTTSSNVLTNQHVFPFFVFGVVLNTAYRMMPRLLTNSSRDSNV